MIKHSPQCEAQDEEILTNNFDQYANPIPSKKQDDESTATKCALNPSFCGALQILLQIFVTKTGTRNASSGGPGYERQNFPRELADEGYIDK